MCARAVRARRPAPRHRACTAPARTGGVLLRRYKYAAIAAVLATGAPTGLLVLWWVTAPRGGALVRDVPTLLYVVVSTLAVFSAFGYVLGRQADALAELSHTDALTGLRNQRSFDERLGEEMARAARYGLPLSLLILDIDGLKAINDQRGHDAGNAALRAVGRALRAGARRSDLAARIGGDEFAVVAPATDGPAARALAERIRLLVADSPGGVSASLGVATLDHDTGSPGALVRAADAALYQAKRDGRNRVVARGAGTAPV
jgi:diguanylate cyclase (GGDEF)-like protein